MALSLGTNEVARRYAVAVFDLAREQGAVDALARDMQVLSDVLTESGAVFQTWAARPIFSSGAPEKVLAALCSAADFATVTRNMLGLLARNGRLSVLPAAVGAVQRLLLAARDEVVAEVRTAHPLSHEQQQALAIALARRWGKTVKMNITPDETLMGGFVVRAGSTLIDASVRSKMARLVAGLKTLRIPFKTTPVKEVA